MNYYYNCYIWRKRKRELTGFHSDAWMFSHVITWKPNPNPTPANWLRTQDPTKYINNFQAHTTPMCLYYFLLDQCFVFLKSVGFALSRLVSGSGNGSVLCHLSTIVMSHRWLGPIMPQLSTATSPAERLGTLTISASLRARLHGDVGNASPGGPQTFLQLRPCFHQVFKTFLKSDNMFKKKKTDPTAWFLWKWVCEGILLY